MTDNTISLNEINDLQTIADTVKQWLDKDKGWKERFAGYAQEISGKEDEITKVKSAFHKSPNLNLYTCIGDIISNKGFNLRYKGQNVAYLKEKNSVLTLLSNKNLDKNNKDYFGWTDSLNCAWDSPEATKFRKHFSGNVEKKGHVEHLYESMLIEEFAKKSSKDKELCNIQPVRIYNQFAFQMTTALSGSGKTIKMSRSARAGGIDILARVKHGANTNLCVIELKKDALDSEQQAHIIRGQGLGYAVFLRELLRSKSGETWYKIFCGHSAEDPEKPVPEKLVIDVCIAAPTGKYDVTTEPADVHLGQDVIRFKYLTFETDNKSITSIKTDLFA